MSLNSKVALVTGGTKGIGYAIAEALAKNGASVFICGRNERDVVGAIEKLSTSGKATGIVCDVRNETDVRTMLLECVREFGGVDILVNNAGMGYFGKTVEELTGDEFRQTLETNLFGVFYTCHYAVPLMKQRGGGYIINISSLAGQNAHPRMAAYNASKFGLNGFSEALMLDHRNDNIRVTYIMPGSVATEFSHPSGRSGDDEWKVQPEDIAQIVLDVLRTPERTLPSRVEVRPSRPRK